MSQRKSSADELERELTRARKELAQTKRWFNTLDSQLRVLDRERQKLSAVVSQSDTLMMMVDIDLVVRWANTAMASRVRESVGANPIGAALEQIWEMLGADLPAPGSRGCPAARAFEEGTAVHAESSAPQHGAPRNLYLTFLPIRTPLGEAAELLVMVQDLTDLEMLRRSERRYRLLFERSPDGMMMVEPVAGRVVLANEAALRLTGYSVDELGELSLQELHESDDWPAAERDYRALLAGDRTMSAQRRLRTRAGEPFTAELSAMGFDLDGRTVTFIQFRDVTERERLEEELRHSQKMEAVGQLAGGVAHDFNNILTVLMGEAELLASTPDMPERARKRAQAIGRETRHASLLTRKLLAISRREVTTIEVLDLNEVLQGLEALLLPLLGETITLHLRLGTEPCPVHADRSQLEQILINLAANARDAMPKGGNLWVEAHRLAPFQPADRALIPPAAADVCLTVRDDGTGMAAPTLERLFEPFFTTKPPGEGTGLGLMTVQRIVREHGGSVEVDSSPGDGTCFRISLPLAGGPVATRRTSDYPRPARKAARVLLVEDRPELLRMCERVLRRAGHDVVAAESAESALAAVRSSDVPFELLVTDVVLPKMSGGELAAEVLGQTPAVQVLYMSGYAEDDVVRRGVSASQAAFLPKPFSPRALLAAVHALLEDEP